MSSKLSSKEDLVFVDLETTGLEPSKHQIIEIAWASASGPARSMVVPHTLENAAPEALKVNGYFERELDKAEVVPWNEALPILHEAFEGKIFVGSKPSFDRDFLATMMDPVWHHRMLDVTDNAMTMLGLEAPVGLATTVELLNSHYDTDLVPQDHTAVGDVLLARSVYWTVQDWRSFISRKL